MKSKIIFNIFLVAILTLLISCENESIRASNSVTTTAYSFSNYSALEIHGDFDAFVTFSDTEEAINIEANSNLQDKIVVSKSGNVLKIRLQDNLTISGNVTLKIYISTNNISRFEIFGDSSVTLENALIAENAEFNLFGDSQFLGEIALDRLSLNARGDSSVNLFGTVTSLDATLSGDSFLEDYDLIVDDLDIKLNGDSEAYLSVTNTIDMNASGDSELNYKGNAEIVRLQLSGDARISKRD
ncbi:hypothetical protein HME9304_02563 [Flagellimonas maritima]|uniref:Putative auto-transporter adhesin head GIN domain-containing protein n=1 Tax=Flagellimonas maritima TaxID=1383885 RepID=A0A2Z4LUW0_9FLAO|nr:hypothetical protein HME9304_02563 [Allomuricauda aurantiaca]